MNLIIEKFPNFRTKLQISQDIIDKDKYYFDSFWESKEALNQFRSDNLYKAIIGAFNVLAMQDRIVQVNLYRASFNNLED